MMVVVVVVVVVVIMMMVVVVVMMTTTTVMMTTTTTVMMMMTMTMMMMTSRGAGAARGAQTHADAAKAVGADHPAPIAACNEGKSYIRSALVYLSRALVISSLGASDEGL